MSQLFTSVYGVGPATAKKWLNKGWKSIDDVRQHKTNIKDERILWGELCSANNYNYIGYKMISTDLK